MVAGAFGTTIADAKRRILAAIYGRHGSSQTASTCRMGLPCEEHGGAVHGQEAEQLRAGVERILRSTAMVSEDDAAFVLEASRRSLIFLLDSIDARDSLSFREMTDPPEKADTAIVSSGDMRSRRVIAVHRSEGEPRTMARVQGMCDERWPGRSSVAWITLDEPRRHVAVTFRLGSGERVEGAAATWLEAMDAVDAARVRRGRRPCMNKPQQPLIKDARGVVRFRANAIVLALLRRDQRALEQVVREGTFSQEDRDQCAQLLGYTIAEYAALIGCPVDDSRLATMRAEGAGAKTPKPRGYDPQPMQPVYQTDQGVIRFRENAIVRDLVYRDSERGRVYPKSPARTDGGLNWIPLQDFPRADQEQLAQLIGYSVSGYHELSYVTDTSAEQVSALMPGAGGCRDKGCPYHGGPLTDRDALS